MIELEAVFELSTAGLHLDDTILILECAIPAAVHALGVEGRFALLDRTITPRGLRLLPQRSAKTNDRPAFPMQNAKRIDAIRPEVCSMLFELRSLGKRDRALPLGSICVLAFGCALFVPRTVHAQRVYVVYGDNDAWAKFNVGLDGEGVVPLSAPVPLSGNTLSGGGGFKIRLGEQFRFAGVRFIPEVGYGYDHLFATDDIGDAFAWDLHRVFGGARLAFGRFIVPGFYAHVGYGWRETGDPYVGNDSGVAFDAGLLLDIHVIPRFGFGAHAEYATIDAQPYAPHWLGVGVHADVVF